MNLSNISSFFTVQYMNKTNLEKTDQRSGFLGFYSLALFMG